MKISDPFLEEFEKEYDDYNLNNTFLKKDKITISFIGRF